MDRPLRGEPTDPPILKRPGDPLLSVVNAGLAVEAHAKLDVMLATLCRRGIYGHGVLTISVADGTMQLVIATGPLA